jgi:hypothetical protein
MDTLRTMAALWRGAVVARRRRCCVSGLKVRAHECMLYEAVGDGAS